MAKIIGQYQGKNIYEGTDAEVSKQMFGNTQQQNSSVSTPNYSINSENLKPIIPSSIAKTTEDTDYSGLLNSSIAQTENNYSSYQKEVDRLNEKAKNESGNISTLQYLLGNKDEDINAEYSKVGADGKSIFDLDKDLGSLNAEASVLKREASAIPLQIQQEFANTGATERGVAPIETGRLRENAIKSLSIAQQSDILTGRLNSAKNIADKLIDAKYSKLDAQIKARQTNLASLEKYELSPAERKLAESTSRKLELEKAELENKKNNERTIQDLIIKASGQGADTGKLTQASKSKTPQEAAIALGQWAGDYWQTEQIKQAIEKSKADIFQTNAETTSKYGGTTNLSSGVVAGYNISSYATDPNHESSVAKLYNNLVGYNFSDANSITQAIKTASSTSPITGEMVLNSANKYGVDPKMVFAMMQQDSSLGTKGTGARNNNPGNIAQFDHLKGAVKGYPTLQAGVDAVADWLSRKKVSTTSTIDPAKFTAGNKTAYQNIQGVIESATNWANKINSNNGVVAGVGLGGLIPNKFIDQNGQDSRTALNALNLKVQQWASGASLTESQTKMVKNFMPTEYDSDTQVKQKINSLVDFMNTQMKTVAQSEGQKFEPGSVDLFKNKELESILNAIETSTSTTPTIPVGAYSSQFNR